MEVKNLLKSYMYDNVFKTPLMIDNLELFVKNQIECILYDQLMIYSSDWTNCKAWKTNFSFSFIVENRPSRFFSFILFIFLFLLQETFTYSFYIIRVKTYCIFTYWNRTIWTNGVHHEVLSWPRVLSTLCFRLKLEWILSMFRNSENIIQSFAKCIPVRVLLLTSGQ
jgi:hypothetical protein